MATDSPVAWCTSAEAGEEGRVIAVKARGFCLYPTVTDGDVLFVDTKRSPRDGNIVFLKTKGRQLLKVYREQGGKIWFEYQKGFDTARLDVEDYTIVGVAISVNKDLLQDFVKIPIVGQVS